MLTTSDSHRILSLLCKRAIPEFSFLKSVAEGAGNAIRSSCVKIVLLLLTFEATHGDDDADDTFADPNQAQSRELLLEWMNDKSWRETVDAEVKNIVCFFFKILVDSGHRDNQQVQPSSFDWSTSPIVAYNLVFSLPEDVRKRVAGLLVPQFQEVSVARVSAILIVV